MIIDEQILREYYDSKVAELGRKFAAERRNRIHLNLKLALILLVSAAAGLGISCLGDSDITQIFKIVGLVLLGLGVIAPIVLYHTAASQARQVLKNAVTGKMVQAIDPGLKYDSQGAVRQGKFEDSKIFLSTPNRYHGEDLVCGSFGGIRMEFSEIDAKVEQRSSKGATTQIQIFKGVFMIIDCNKFFKHTTVVVPDAAEGLMGQLLGNFLQNMNMMRSGSLMRMENVDFEKKFVVYADDKVEACYLLTPNIMEIMCELQVRYPKIAFSFRHNSLYVAIPRSQNLFEYPAELSFEAFAKVYFQIVEFISFIPKLGLDVRIWSKK
ncbi:MAG: DUF3137 domain-containing protein [Victivallaceae bacterium]